jgi:Chitobiase/beta-hexosaminidase C-terminal domain/Fn3 associated/Concanavalin A-like lectin/glucanases superfamily
MSPISTPLSALLGGSSLISNMALNMRSLIAKLFKLTWFRSRFGFASLAAVFVLAFAALPALASEPAPSISPSYRLFGSGPQTVSISDSDDTATIYYTTDGSMPTSSSPTFTGSFSVSAASTTVQAIAIGTGGTSGVATSVIQIDPSANTILNFNGFYCWLRADNGPVTSGSSITQWTNLVQLPGTSFVQSTSTAQPTLVTGAINGLPAVQFDGSSQFMQNSNDLQFIDAGVMVFMVAKPVSPVPSNATLIDFGNAGADDIAIREPSANGAEFIVNSLGTPSSITAPSAIQPGQFQLIEVSGGSSTLTGTIRTNGVLEAFGGTNQLSDAARTSNFIGQWNDGTGLFNGQIAEIIVIIGPLPDQQRVLIEDYLSARYALPVPPPVISPGTGVYNTTQQVTLTADPSLTIYYTLDGTQPTTSSSVYSTAINLTGSTVVNAIAVRGSSISPVATSYIQNDGNSYGVPKSGLALWLRTDFGLTANSGSVSQWVDMSGNTVANQTSVPNQPQFVTNDINGKSVVRFDGISQNMKFDPMYASFTGGSLFAVVKPFTLKTGATLIDLANGPTSDNVTLDEPDTTGDVRFHVFNGATDSSIQTSSSVISSGIYSLQEAIQNGAGSATLFCNGVQSGSGSVNNINSLIRSNSYLGARSDGTNLFSGSLAELIFYSRPVTAIEQGFIEGYLLNKYQLLFATPASPTFSLAGSTLTGPMQVAIEAPSNVNCFYTVDGSTPSQNSTLYVGPIPINFTQTIKAIAVKNGLASAVASATYSLDSIKWPAPNPSATTPLDINVQLPTVANPR